MWRHH
jgi:hypothetical protein